MREEDKEIVDEFVIESMEHMADIESQLLTIEAGGACINLELVNTVFRAIHSIKGAAEFLALVSIKKLAHSMENVLNLLRERRLIPTPVNVEVLLRAADQLTNLLSKVEQSNEVDVDKHVAALEAVVTHDSQNATVNDQAPQPTPAPKPAKPLAQKPAARKRKATVKAEGKPPRPIKTAPATNSGDQASMVGVATNSVAANIEEHSPAVEASVSPDSHGESEDSCSESKACLAVISKVETNIRVSVESLDRLMNLAGELVLARNQLLQSAGVGGGENLDAVVAKINQITCELQDAIMQTRMQPIGNVFSRFTRVVRDLSSKLGKQCELKIEGREVEVDKTIIEAIADPLTHLVRNAVDHGLESPDVRKKRGKTPGGLVQLRAFHQSGKVCIEIKDDGAGIDVNVIKRKAVEKGLITKEQAAEISNRDAYSLIFMPGFSTAEIITDLSGRGVGMDVVRTNIEKLGGTVEVASKLGVGTKIYVTLPLTLAIIPSLIVHSHSHRFAIPQVNIVELVRVRGAEALSRIGRVKEAEVLRLRGELLPLVRLDQALSLEDESLGKREASLENAMNIVVVETGVQRYGLVVDGLFDSEEIVVKPLGRHLKECRCLSGATILGDGRVALILDVAGIAGRVHLGSTNHARAGEHAEVSTVKGDSQSLLLFGSNQRDQFAIPMGVVSRIERVRAPQIHRIGRQLVLQYANSSLPLIRLDEHLQTAACEELDRLFVVVFETTGKEVGLVVPVLKDIRDVTAVIDDVTLREPGVVGSLVIDQITTRLIDVFELVASIHPDWTTPPTRQSESEVRSEIRILLAEDSKFFRNQVKKHLVQSGYSVCEAEDGQEAWEILNADPSKIDLIITDVQMPRMNGFELCERVKHDPRTAHMPVITLSSLAGDEDTRRGEAAGVDEYHVKMDREKLLRGIERMCQRIGKKHPAEAAGPVLAPLNVPLSAIGNPALC